MRSTTSRDARWLNDANLLRSGDEFEAVASIEHVGGDVEDEAIVVPEMRIGQVHTAGRQFQQAFWTGVERGGETAVGCFGDIVVAEDLKLDEDLRRLETALHGLDGHYAQILKPAPDPSIFQRLREFAQPALLDDGAREQGGAQIIQAGRLAHRHLNKRFIFGQDGHDILQ